MKGRVWRVAALGACAVRASAAELRCTACTDWEQRSGCKRAVHLLKIRPIRDTNQWQPTEAAATSRHVGGRKWRGGGGGDGVDGGGRCVAPSDERGGGKAPQSVGARGHQAHVVERLADEHEAVGRKPPARWFERVNAAVGGRTVDRTSGLRSKCDITQACARVRAGGRVGA